MKLPEPDPRIVARLAEARQILLRLAPVVARIERDLDRARAPYRPLLVELERTDAALPDAFKEAAERARGDLTEEDARALFELARPAYRWGSEPAYGQYRRDRDDFITACLRYATGFSAIVRGLPMYDSAVPSLVAVMAEVFDIREDTIRHAWRKRRIANWGRPARRIRELDKK